MVKENSKLVVLSAGGTGGHMTPAAALSRDLISRGYKVALVTDTRGQKYENMFDGADIHVIKAGTLGTGILGKLKGLAALGVGMMQARKLIDKLKPMVVVGFGGYPSYPAVHAAQKAHIPTVIHQSDAVLGKANAMLAPKADRIALSFAHVEGLDDADRVRAVVTGNPVREDIAALFNKPYPALDHDSSFHIFVTGGSLGASIFADIVPETLAKLPAEYRARLNVVQQCREENLAQVEDVYKAAGIKAQLDTFFDDIPQLLEKSHLYIGRSGASTVAEVAAAGRPAIFVPYPHHKDNQQKINADAVADRGGAWVMTQEGFTVEALLARIETFMQNPESLFRAAEAARECGRPDAARRLGNLVTALASGWDKRASRSYDITQGHH
jgi:UDP-N-acetylglucosamine--N-acetylmuramyl-(pentapeptide) pyrophosphoryl-undecaprenol N-acetylglucosamine transferase